MRKVSKEGVDSVKRLKKLSIRSIMDELGVSNSLARTYKDIVQNRLVVGSNKDGDIKRYLVLGCIHIPFQNKAIMQGIYDMMYDHSFDGLVLNGDFLDMGALSSYDKGKINTTGVTLQDEFDEGNKVLDKLMSLLPSNAELYWNSGNHTDRYFKWKSDVNNSKYGDKVANPFWNLKLYKRGFIVNENYNSAKVDIGSLDIIHGFYHNVHCAKKHLDTFRRNILFNHTHRIQTYREGDFAAYNCGFLGDINAPIFSYANAAMKSAWANGFAIVNSYTLTDEHFVDTIGCVNNSFVYAGKLYGAK